MPIIFAYGVPFAYLGNRSGGMSLHDAQVARPFQRLDGFGYIGATVALRPDQCEFDRRLGVLALMIITVCSARIFFFRLATV